MRIIKLLDLYTNNHIASINQGYPLLFCMKGSEEVQHTETRSFSTLTLLQVGQEVRAHVTFIHWRDSKLVS